MTEIRACIELAAPPEDVWETLTDLQRLDEWVVMHCGWPEPPPDEVREGDRFAQELQLEGHTFTVLWTVERLRPPQRLDWTGEGPAGATAAASYRLQETAAGTRLEYVSELDLPGGPVGRTAERIVEPRSEALAEETLQHLKGLVEGAPAR